MDAIVERMAYKGDVPWAGHGEKITMNLSPEQMLKKAGLDWTVSKREVFLADGSPVPRAFALCRDTDNYVLSPHVSAKYKYVQNADAMDFFKKFAAEGKMKMEHAGSLLNGRYMWAMAHIDADFALKGDDEVSSYVLLLSPHVLGRAMVIQSMAVRRFCWNTLPRLLSVSGKRGAFRMPHTIEFTDAVKARAAQALGLATDQMIEFKEAAQLLSRKKAKKADVEDFFGEVCELDRGAYDRLNVKVTKKGDPIEPKMLPLFREALHQAPGQDAASARGTWWGAFNAVTYVIDHEIGKQRDTALRTAWFGNKARVKRDALTIALKRAA